MTMKTRLKNVFSILAIVLGCVFFVPPSAHANISMNAYRIVFNDRDRMADIVVGNTGRTPAIFKLQFYHLRQTETGVYEELDGPIDTTVFNPETALVFSPKQVRLPPQGRQKIRLSLRRPADLPPGEYRVHLRLDSIAEPQPEAPVEPGKIVPRMTVNVGFSIPVIIRQGESDTTSKILETKLIPAEGKKPAFLEVKASRIGKYGIIGNMIAYWTAPGQKEVEIGRLNNFNIYTENAHRISRLPLYNPNIPNGTIRVVYEGEGPDKEKIFDEKIFPVGG